MVLLAPATTSSAAVAGPATASAATSGTASEITRLDAAHRRALRRAQAALGSDPAPGARAALAPDVRRPDATLALRDLFLARPGLDSDQDATAGRLLARPSDGSGDAYGDGYTVPSVKKCDGNVCVHWVRSTRDAPPDDAWARKTLAVMGQVWRHHVNELGYRRPVADGGRGGNAKFDVYLKELGRQGLYGYCAPERRAPREKRQASGFCVLDDDFARGQFGRAPIDTLRVTAAHEFFHAVQFAYDFGEDPWLLESTATWMEERFADSVNDNRAFLAYGQLARPATSLDLFEANGFAHYGNWPFWEYLSENYGNGIVRQVIQRTGTGGNLPNDYSVEALRRVLRAKGGLPAVFAAYAAGNGLPERNYDEGKAYPRAAPAEATTLGKDRPAVRYSTRINHLASKSLKLKPDDSLSGRRWQLQVKVNAPGAATSPAAYVVVKRTNGSRFQRPLELNANGFGTTTLAFDRRTVAAVTITLANVSTRYRCRKKSPYACAGTPRDQRAPFTAVARISRG